MQQAIIIRLVATPTQRVKEGKVERVVPGVSAERLAAAVRPLLEPQIKRRFGEDVALVLEGGRAPDIRLSGKFGKPGEVKQELSEMLADAFDGLDPEALRSS